ncbi:Glucosaminyl phosphatidylinositol (GlcN-PI) nositol acylation protein [Puccinia graminis f. sp. tritici]|uniref:GPI-anchored wall transfer protein n=1 Tax=Puccinia graminis f. sp. tritici TaxID=56615 RepID=A0A5B0R2Z5_PUCGR|nr:Glucosaminyl phosphatidylinositol (GlcN-PI) nositol acylation protein [Puccinia graminis f. sp. tritici]
MTSYKEEKEGFVSNGGGCSGSDIVAILASLLLTHLLHRSLNNNHVEKRPDGTNFGRMMTELTSLVVPLLAITTILSEWLWTSNLCLALAALIGSRMKRETRKEERRGPGATPSAIISSNDQSEHPLIVEHHPHHSPLDGDSQNTSLRRRLIESDHQVLLTGFPVPDPSSSSSTPKIPAVLRFSHQPFLTIYRAQLVLLTSISILAVDFTIFPRKFAKTESWGISLMDSGVGSFVFSLGIISALPILKRVSSSLCSTNLPQQPILSELWRSTRKTVPLFLLGLIRIIFVKGVDYPEHVTEYGVHWNFFFTLSILPLTGVLTKRFYERFRTNLALIGLLLAICHQSLLSVVGIQEYVLSSRERTSLISANREGLASIPGYMVIYVLGLSAGTYILPPSPDFLDRVLRDRQNRSDKLVSRQPGKALVVYSSWAIIWWSLFFLCNLFGFPPSRRLANPTYCFWIAALNLSLITGHSFIHDVLFRPDHPSSKPLERSQNSTKNIPLIFQFINQNSLAIFLFANLLTGLINLSVHSIYLDPTLAFFLLLLYSVLITIFAWSIKSFKLSL